MTRTTGTADTHVHAAQRRSLRLHSAGRLSHLQRGPLRDPWKLPAPPRPPALDISTPARWPPPSRQDANLTDVALEKPPLG